MAAVFLMRAGLSLKVLSRAMSGTPTRSAGLTILTCGLIDPNCLGAVMGTMKRTPANDEFLRVINEKCSARKIPFNRLLGLSIESMGPRKCVTVSFRMRGELMGHRKRRMVHGGVISSVIDVTGGLVAFMGAQERMDKNAGGQA